jgi:hypothetical protein
MTLYIRPLTLVSALATILILQGCGSITRVERDTYTKVNLDTVVTTRVQNAPGERDNGIIFPSTTTQRTDRDVQRYDSVAVREYPAFIRLGLFEGIGTIGSAIGDAASAKRGTFGLFYPINDLLFGRSDDSSTQVFDGYIYRIGIAEWKLPIFGSSPDWTWGVTAYESIHADADNSLSGIGVLTVSKRFYYRSEIPYLSLRPSISLAAFPYQYVNTSVSADLGSIGGMNLRAYVGYAFGGSFGVSGRGRGRVSTYETIDFPYFGLGISTLDFVNREEETNTEWKYHEHSAWEIGALDFTFLGSNADRSFFSPLQSGADAPIIKGLTGRFAIADLALPVFNYHLSVGTSLFEALMLGPSEYGIGVLPIRFTYHWFPFKTDLRVEPFFEVSYAPSTFAHLGVRTAIPIGEQSSIQLVAGYVQGNTGSSIPGLDGKGYSFITDRVGNVTAADPNFKAVYIGIGASLYDRLFKRKELRYGKGYPHE